MRNRPIVSALCATLTLAAALVAAPEAWAGPTTPIRSWTPTGVSARFKHATTCHDTLRDVYVIGAVFELPDTYFGGTYDVLYHLRVEGNSTSPAYGELLGAAPLTSSRRIDNVDCTTDDAGQVFLAYDRMSQNAAWYRLQGSAVQGPYQIQKVGWCGPFTHRPRLAYAGGASPRLMVAYEGYTYGSPGSASCGAAIAGTEEAIWNDNMTHSDYDVEWNGARFIMALPYDIDAGDGHGHLSTYVWDLAGNLTASHHIQSFAATPTPAYPTKTRLVYSKNSRNTYNRLFLQTDLGSYWLYPGGSLYPTPQSNPIGTQSAVCEYWGSDNGTIAATFSPTTTWRWVPGFPYGYFLPERKTLRAHYGQTPAAPYESSVLNINFYPEACDGANTYVDPEVMLVSVNAGGHDANVYWNIVAND